MSDFQTGLRMIIWEDIHYTPLDARLVLIFQVQYRSYSCIPEDLLYSSPTWDVCCYAEPCFQVPYFIVSNILLLYFKLLFVLGETRQLHILVKKNLCRALWLEQNDRDYCAKLIVFHTMMFNLTDLSPLSESYSNGFDSVKDRTSIKGVFQISFCPRVLEYIFISGLDHYCSEP